MPDASLTPLTQAFYQLRGIAYREYYRLAHANYDWQLFATRKRTPAGSFRSYEPYNRHGRDEMLAALSAACDPDAVIYDIGANIGVYALALAAEAPNRQVFAFEPAPPVADRLRANVRVNDFGDRIDVEPVGLGEEATTRPFYISTYTELSAFDREQASRWEANVIDVHNVPVSRLDDCLDERPVPDAIKIDVEGAEAAVIRGGHETLTRHRPTLFLEVHEGAATATRHALEDIDAEYDIDTRENYWQCEPA